MVWPRTWISIFSLVESELVEDRGVKITVIVTVLDRPVADLVGGPVDDPALDPAPGHPGGVALWPPGCSRLCFVTRGPANSLDQTTRVSSSIPGPA